MFQDANPYNLNCPSRDVLALIGGKWAILILCCLQQGPVRTGALLRQVGGISPKMLTQTLRELERDGFVARTSHPEVPPRVEYRLTELGRSLSEVARGLEQWIVAHYPRILEHRRRAAGREPGTARGSLTQSVPAPTQPRAARLGRERSPRGPRPCPRT